MSEPNQFLLYTAPSGAVKVDVFFKNETVWLTQKALAELFAVNVPAINKHLKNIFDSGELTRAATVSKMEIVRAEGGREVACEVEFYHLDAIIAAGSRVNSYQATQFSGNAGHLLPRQRFGISEQFRRWQGTAVTPSTTRSDENQSVRRRHQLKSVRPNPHNLIPPL